MKKSILIVALAALVAGSASAQLKGEDVLKQFSSSSSPEQLTALISKIQPELANSKDAALWFAAGKAEFTLYDQLQVAKTVKKADIPAKDLADALMTGYGYLKQALPLDTVFQFEKDGSPKIDKKTGTQKFKVKYSEEINNLLKGHAADFGNTANTCFSAQEYASAATAFGLYGKLAKEVNPQLPDSVYSEIKFFEGYSQYANKDYLNSLHNLLAAQKLGYTANNIGAYVNASVANLVQSYMDTKDYAGAYTTLDKLIALEPSNGMFYDFKGIVFENDTTKANAIDEAQALYLKATEVDPKCAQAFFDAGRSYYLQAKRIIDDPKNATATNAQLAPKLLPLYDKAMPYLNKAKEIDSSIKNAQLYIDDINYKLGFLRPDKKK